MLARMRRKRISFALLVGMQTGAATLENSLEVPQKIKNRTTLNPAITLLGNYPRDTAVLIRRGTCTPMFIAALSTIAKLWKEPMNGLRRCDTHTHTRMCMRAQMRTHTH